MIDSKISIMDAEDAPQVILRTVRRSARTRTCRNCKGLIYKGERYERILLKFEGRCYSENHHTYSPYCAQDCADYNRPDDPCLPDHPFDGRTSYGDY